MKIVNASFNVLSDVDGFKILRNLERIARVCYKSEDKILPNCESAIKLVMALIKNGHEAMLEHESISVMFTVDRGVSHEMVRHRLASFAQESTRYCNYSSDKFGNEITVIKPTFLSPNTPAYMAWFHTMKTCEDEYFDILNYGYSPQQARSVLPNSLKTDIVITANLREWRHIISLRTAHTAHPQMREVMVPLSVWLCKNIPVIFDDVIDPLLIAE